MTITNEGRICKSDYIMCGGILFHPSSTMDVSNIHFLMPKSKDGHWPSSLMTKWKLKNVFVTDDDYVRCAHSQQTHTKVYLNKKKIATVKTQSRKHIFHLMSSKFLVNTHTLIE